MAITLAGKITDITNRSPDQVTRATVKYPTYTIGEAGALATSAPREVQVAADGSFTLDVTAGKGWLFLEGPGWSESVGFVAASGMSLFIEAVANFDASPIYGLIRELIDALGGTTEAELQALVEQARIYMEAAKNAQATGVAWDKGIITSAIGTLDNAPIGVAAFPFNEAAALQSPIVQPGTVRTVQAGSWKYQWVTSAAGGRAVTYKRIFTGSAWTAWEKESAPWAMGVLDSAKHTLDTMPDGLWIVQLADAAKVGAPVSGRGWAQQITASGWRYQQFTTASGGRPVTWKRVYADGKWFDWSQTIDKKELDAAISAAVAALPTPGGGGGPASGFKIVPVALTVGNDGSTKADLEGSFRLPVKLAAPVTRWRLCVSTMHMRNNSGTGAQVALANVRYGLHGGGGAFASASSLYYGSNVTCPADGTVQKLPWVSYPFGEDKELLIHFDYSTPNGVQSVKWYGHGFSVPAGNATTQAPAATKEQKVPLDWWIEVETPATTPVVGAIGDSLTCGQGAVDSLQNSWLSQYCRAKKALPMHYALAGDTMARWIGLTKNHLIHRMQAGTPDVVIMAMGSNDLATGATLADMQTRFAGMVKIAQSISPNVHAMTIFPREAWAAGADQARNDYNAWLKLQTTTVRDVHDAAAALTDTDGTMINAYNSGDNIHLNDAGYGAVAGEITRPITTPPVQYVAV